MLVSSHLYQKHNPHHQAAARIDYLENIHKNLHLFRLPLAFRIASVLRKCQREEIQPSVSHIAEDFLQQNLLVSANEDLASEVQCFCGEPIADFLGCDPDLHEAISVDLEAPQTCLIDGCSPPATMCIEFPRCPRAR